MAPDESRVGSPAKHGCVAGLPTLQALPRRNCVTRNAGERALRRKQGQAILSSPSSFQNFQHPSEFRRSGASSSVGPAPAGLPVIGALHCAALAAPPAGPANVTARSDS